MRTRRNHSQLAWVGGGHTRGWQSIQSPGARSRHRARRRQQTTACIPSPPTQPPVTPTTAATAPPVRLCCLDSASHQRNEGEEGMTEGPTANKGCEREQACRESAD